MESVDRLRTAVEKLVSEKVNVPSNESALEEQLRTEEQLKTISTELDSITNSINAILTPVVDEGKTVSNMAATNVTTESTTVEKEPS